MLKLESLQLENFQCHGRVVVVFSPTITTIKGPSDVGKSSILRALGWVCLNNIPGDEFIKEGEKETTVTLTLSDGKEKRVIVRRRGKHDNAYELDGEEYKAFGQDVPPDIRDLLQLNNINFQNQHDSPFWFNESAPEISRRLNAVVDLTVIDTALSNIAASVRQAQERVALTDERLVEAKTELEKLEPQRTRVEEFKSLKTLHEQFTQHNQRHDRLVSVLGRVRQCRDLQRNLEEKSDDGRRVLEDLRGLLDLTEKNVELVGIIRDARALQGVKAPPDFAGVEAADQDRRKAAVAYAALDRIVESIRVATSKAMNAREKLEEADQKFHAQTKDKLCPLCNQTLS